VRIPGTRSSRSARIRATQVDLVGVAVGPELLQSQRTWRGEENRRLGGTGPTAFLSGSSSRRRKTSCAGTEGLFAGAPC
jgi:hypothetical protein